MCRGMVSWEAGEGVLKPSRGHGQKEGELEPAPPADVRGSDSSQGITEDGRWAGRVPTRDSFAVVRYLLGKGDGGLGLQALYFCWIEFSPG